MSLFSEATLEKKFLELNSSQQSIQTLSLWIIHHKKHYKYIVQLWLKEVKNANKAKKLTYIYLANDVIQNSKKKMTEYVKEFAPALFKALQDVAAVLGKADGDHKIQDSINRVLGVWEERNIYDKAQMKKFRQSFALKRSKPEDDVPPEKPVIKKRKVEPVVVKEEEQLTPGEPPEAEELIKALSDLEYSASTDAEVRQKISKLPPELSDSNSLNKLKDKESIDSLNAQVQDALKLLADYNNRLSQEQEDRKQVAKMLSNFTLNQKKLQEQNEQEIAEFTEKLNQINQVRKELKQHLQKLPDMSRLPHNSKNLDPLPSAGDLFNTI